jgi:penicillin-binding protein-related factor A (putative recombinase)
MSQKNNHSNLAGEFYALSRLLLEGYDASLTLGNTKGVDILLINKIGKQFKVEVKTSTTIMNEKIFGGKNIRWMMNKKHEDLIDPNLVYCFIYISKEKKYSLFIVPSKKVAEYCKWESEHWINSPHKKEIKITDQRCFCDGTSLILER